MKGLPEAAYEFHPGRRLHAVRVWLASQPGDAVTKLAEAPRWNGQPWPPHSSCTLNAWGHVLVPGPGQVQGRTDNPWEPYFDWRPGIGQAQLNVAMFPDYIHAPEIDPLRRRRSRLMWDRLRAVLGETEVPGVPSAERLALWGVTNFSTTLAHSEQLRGKNDPGWDRGRVEWVLRTCRAHFIVHNPGLDDDVAAALRHLGGQLVGSSTEYPRRGRAVTWWSPWGLCRVFRAYQHPSRWAYNIADCLTRDIRAFVADGGN